MRDKSREARLWGVTNQNSTIRMVSGDSSGGTFTAINNPLRGTLFWDHAIYVLQGVSVAGGATGGSYTVTIQTDAVKGYTGLPIARATIGPLTKTTVVMDNLHHCSGSPLPTHIFVSQTAAGGGIWFQANVIAKQYRGSLRFGPINTAERVIQGNLIRGTSAGGQFATDAGVAASATFTLGTTGSTLGMHQMRCWDVTHFWAVAGNSVSGTHDVSLVGKIGGKTATFATTGVAGAITAAGDKVALTNQVYGACPNPTQILWTVVSAGGVSDFRVVALAKTGYGSIVKN